MTWTTHALLGIASLWLLAPFPPPLIGYDIGTLAACATLGAFLPDLDASESKIKHLKLFNINIKPFLPLALFVSRTEQHRGLLHSFVGLGMVAFMTIPFTFWTGWAPIAALILGYSSHLLGDAMTKSGLRLFYPRPVRFYLLPRRYRLTTGSPVESLFAACVLPGVLVLLFHGLFSPTP